MAYNQATQVLSKSRYTVPRLRELSLSSSCQFDLSKFSFDAVRAGVVPALNQCTMSLREPHANRPRGWSSETMSSAEDHVVYPGNGGKVPIRQPHNAPTDPLAQTHQGFARFLKKHASPTHQRVTAGGRIVPMETRSAPPPFALRKETSPRKEVGPQSRETERTIAIDTSTGDHVAAGIPRSDTVTLQLASANDAAFRAHAGIAPGSGLDFTTDGIADMTYGISPLPFSPMLQTVTYASGVLADHSTMPTPPMLFQGAMPVIAPVPTYPNQYPISPFANSIWSFPDPYMVSLLQPPLETTFDTPQLLSQADAEFQELDRQLKDLDRDRAMNDFDRTRAVQRVEIVDRRAKAHETARRLRLAMNIEPAVSQIDISVSSSHRLNVEAAAWVPAAVAHGSQSVRIQKPDDAEKKTLTTEHPTSSIKLAAPTSHQDPFLATAPPDSPELEGFDEWGVRLGRAPPELERQQSEMLESMTSERSSSPRTSEAEDEKFVVAEPCEPQQPKVNDKNAFTPEDGASDTDSETSRPARAPPAVEKDYALHLDAMRKPMGITTHVRTHEGHVFAVAGQALKRPASVDMTEFEQKYWSRSGESGQDANDDQVRDQENSMTIIEKARGWTSEIEGNYCNRISTSRGRHHQKILVDIFKGSANDRHGGGSGNSSKHIFSENEAIGPLKAPSDSLNGSGSGGLQSPVGDVEMNFSDTNGNKGYSSVAVQNIHAMSRLPHGLDGAIDKIQRVASASKVKSPRILHRTTPTGNAWYGPFRREILEQIERGEGATKALQGAYF